MLCPKCGKDVNITNESRFCNYCGFHFKVLPEQHEWHYGDNDDPQQVMKKIGEQMDEERRTGGYAVMFFLFLFVGIPVLLILVGLKSILGLFF